MKFIVVSLYLIILSVVAIKGLTPPTISKQFTTNYTIVATDYVQNATSLFSGYIALDYKNGGGVYTISGEEYIPLFISTNVLANPNLKTGEITGYIYEGSLCWDVGSVPKSFLVLFPLEIPDDATFTGNITSDGKLCSTWMWMESYLGYSVQMKMWVAYQDGSIVRIYIDQIPYLDNIEWIFYETQVGPFNPNIYAPPKQHCTSSPMNFEHLFDRFAMMLKLYLSLGRK